jgi:hypothetical protein
MSVEVGVIMVGFGDEDEGFWGVDKLHVFSETDPKIRLTGFQTKYRHHTFSTIPLTSKKTYVL